MQAMYRCPIRFPYQIMFVLFRNYLTSVACEAGKANPSGAPAFTPVFKYGSCCSILSLLCSTV